jgi:capsule polysaccharide export protein KpsE/RkpR
VPMMPVMSDEEDLIDLKHAVDRHEQAITEDAIQIAALKSEIETLKEQHGKEIESLQGDIENLAELVWCIFHRVRTQALNDGIDDRHWNMALALANKHGVAFPGSQP